RPASGLGRRRSGALVGLLALDLGFVDSRHAHDLLFLGVQRDEPHALRGATDYADLTDRHPNQDPGVRDQHHLVFVPHLADAGDLAVPLGGPDGDEALATAALEPVLRLDGALAV